MGGQEEVLDDWVGEGAVVISVEGRGGRLEGMMGVV